jgi:hypothetical protein
MPFLFVAVYVKNKLIVKKILGCLWVEGKEAAEIC